MTMVRVQEPRVTMTKKKIHEAWDIVWHRGHVADQKVATRTTTTKTNPLKKRKGKKRIKKTHTWNILNNLSRVGWVP